MTRLLDRVSRRFGWRRFRLPHQAVIGYRLNQYTKRIP